MDRVKIIEVKESAFRHNETEAENLRKELKSRGTYLINLMSSPGAGKTTMLTKLLNILNKDLKIAVMEADIDSDVDAVKISEMTKAEAIQLHTGGMCHLDASMTSQGIKALKNTDYDLIILENVGNLVCPAEFDTGASLNMSILSVPEGDDKPLKYPLMYKVCGLIVINKTDVLPWFDFDMEKCRENIKKRNPEAEIIPVSAKTGEGIEILADRVLMRVREWKENRNA